MVPAPATVNARGRPSTATVSVGSSASTGFLTENPAGRRSEETTKPASTRSGLRLNTNHRPWERRYVNLSYSRPFFSLDLLRTRRIGPPIHPASSLLLGHYYSSPGLRSVNLGFGPSEVSTRASAWSGEGTPSGLTRMGYVACIGCTTEITVESRQGERC